MRVCLVARRVHLLLGEILFQRDADRAREGDDLSGGCADARDGSEVAAESDLDTASRRVDSKVLEHDGDRLVTLLVMKG